MIVHECTILKTSYLEIFMQLGVTVHIIICDFDFKIVFILNLFVLFINIMKT